jgi:glutamate--cysteine ligase
VGQTDQGRKGGVIPVAEMGAHATNRYVSRVSTVLPTKDGVDDSGEPLGGEDELLEYFRAGEKTRDRFRVGTEHEKFGFLHATKEPLPYFGEVSIEAILDAIADDPEEQAASGWVKVKEGEHTIALASPTRGSISLEPGGQLELSGAPLATMRETCTETGRHLKLMKRFCKPMGVGFIGIGFHPTASWEDMPTVPKSRYGIMDPYMRTKGKRGVDMMKRTATVQANFDYGSEADMVAAFRTSLLVSPLVTALFANSPFKDGKPSGVLSERTLCWADTDPDRSGFPAPVLADGFGYEAWTQWLLDMPMYFIRRDGVHHNYAGASFRDFMSQGIDGHRATLRDWEDHLTTAFPEVRVKQFLEVRSADCGPWSRICALPALWKGILYNEHARDEAAALMEGATSDELLAVQQDAARRGFEGEFRGEAIHARCERLVEIALNGLERQRPEGGRSEIHFLGDVVDAVQERRTFAERLLARYRGDWGGDISHLWEHLEFYADD